MEWLSSFSGFVVNNASTPIFDPIEDVNMMDPELDALLNRPEMRPEVHRPQIFTLPDDGAAVKALLRNHANIQVLDRIQAQLRELIKSLNPSVRFTEESLQKEIANHLNGSSLNEYGSWVFYPWSQKLVHLLGPEEFALVRTDRNRNKITREEQAVLAGKKVGVVGLSVGQSVSLAMALERSFGEIRLADFDTLDLSNLNRIRTGTHHLGMNKAVITAREIAEVDPYLHVVCFTEGLTRENMDAFFLEGGKLDVLVEECDSVDIKIQARQKAKAFGIPVVMDMSDRGCLDVERFDLEPDRAIMHGWIDHLDLEAASRPMSAEEKVPYMLPITGVETLSPRMKASVIELGQTISTWPQLATSVALGGALAGDAVRRIALGEFHASGRWHVDIEEQIADPPADPPPPPAPEVFHLHASEADELEQRLGPAPEGAIAPGQQRLEQLVEAGGLAPSAGNMQPWKFLWHGKRLWLFRDPERSRSFWDPDHLIAHLGLGACVENVVLKAHELGLEVVVSPFPVPGHELLVATFEFHGNAANGADPHVADELAAMIPKRHTSRSLGNGSPIPEASLDPVRRMLEAEDAFTCRWAQGRDELTQLASLYGQAERILLMHPEGHRDYFGRTLRWTDADAALRQDGVDIASYALPPMAEAALKVTADPRAVELTRAWDAGQGLGMIPAWAIGTSAAVVMLAIEKNDPLSHLKAGRAIQRAWLAAGANQVAVQPMDAACRIAGKWAQAPGGFSAPEQRSIGKFRKGLLELCGAMAEKPILLLRMFNPTRPPHPSHRQAIDRTLTIPTPHKA